MLFNSFSFIIFFTVTLVFHYLPFSWRQRKLNLLLASYLFYAAWNPPFVLIIWLSTATDWFIARRIHRTEPLKKRRSLLLLSLSTNLGILGFFKYGGFLLDNFILLVNSVGFDYSPAKPNIILPVGISFYTFQTLSYTLDVYHHKHNKTVPWHSFLDYALFVTFFPQLVAGPIVRGVDFLPQCANPPRRDPGAVGRGLSLFFIGLFSKQVIADLTMAPIVERVFDGVGNPGFTAAWAGTLAFAVQIFCDFAGYSACAIGIAMCLGFYLPRNFRYPYGGIGFSDFWQRWHISLSSWLRDYLYIPLGGNRKGPTRTNINLCVTMLLGGLWHGASWLFVIWGALHGLFLLLEKLARRSAIARLRFWECRVGRIALALTTFFCVCLAWVFFRAPSLSRAWQMTCSMLAYDDGVQLSRRDTFAAFFFASVFFISHYLLRDGSIKEVINRVPRWLQVGLFGCMLYAIFMSFTAHDRAFIYFQF